MTQALGNMFENIPLCTKEIVDEMFYIHNQCYPTIALYFKEFYFIIT